MRKSTAKLFFGIMLILILAIGGLYFFWNMKRNAFAWEYTLTDDTHWKTLMDDGGSNTNVYYQLNFTDRKVRKCEDKFVGPLHVYDYRERVIYEIDMDEKTSQKFQTLLDKLYRTGSDQEGNAGYYTIEKEGEGKRYLSSNSAISQIKVYTDLLNKRAES